MACSQYDDVAGPLYTKSISLKMIPLQGREALQLNITATFELEDPLMFLYVTSFTCTKLP